MPIDILSSSKKARRKKIFIKAGLVLAGIFVVSVSIAAFFYIPKFRIKNISIDGLMILKNDELKTEISIFLSKKRLGVLPYDNIFILPKRELADFLYSKFPPFKKISVERNFPEGIFVSAEERKPEALWCLSQNSTSTDAEELALRSLGEGGCAFIDENGFIFRDAPYFSGSIFLKFFDKRKESMTIGKNILETGEFLKLFSFYKKLEEKDFNAANIALKDGDIHEIYLKEGWYIILNNKNEPDISFSNFEIALDQAIKDKRPSLEYLDLRFGNKVFYKLR